MRDEERVVTTCTYRGLVHICAHRHRDTHEEMKQSIDPYIKTYITLDRETEAWADKDYIYTHTTK